MKRYGRIIYILVMAALVLSMSGCDWIDDDETPKKKKSATTDKLMVITSPALKKDESYMIYRGDKVRVTGTTAKYYIAPLDNNDDSVTMNLLFSDVISQDFPFVITKADEDYVAVISYNPGGSTFRDVKTEYGNVIRSGGGTQKLRYNSLNVAGASASFIKTSAAPVEVSALDFDSSKEIVINLEDNTASIVSGSGDISIKEHDFVWHADPYHRYEYYTDGIDGDEITEDDMNAEIFGTDDDNKGKSKTVRAYIAHDIRYMSKSWNFEGLISADGRSEHVAYYSEAVVNEVAEELGIISKDGQCIFATIPVMYSINLSDDEDLTEEGENEDADDEDEDNEEEDYADDDEGENDNSEDSYEEDDEETSDETENEEEEEEEEDTEDAAFTSSSLVYTEMKTLRTMRHTANEAYINPVLHIIEPGTYRLKGTWNGQIMLDPGKKKDITVILDGVTILCNVGPAIVFQNVRECLDMSDTDDVTADDIEDTLKNEAGAKLIIANKSINDITGSNVYRIMAADRANKTVKAINGKDLSQQKQLYKMDGAIHSLVSLAVGAESNSGGGRLNIISTTFKGLCSDTNLFMDSGIISVIAEDDGISTNGDDSAFIMNSGSLSITSETRNGIYSAGDIFLNNGTIAITTVIDSDTANVNDAIGPLNAEGEVYMSDNITYTNQTYIDYIEYIDNEGGDDNTDDEEITIQPMDKQTIVVHNESGAVILRIDYTTPIKDEETEARTISKSGNVFTLEHKVNSFSGVAVEKN